MGYHSLIYGLRVHLNESVPGLLFSNPQSLAPDVDIQFGCMPSWFQQRSLTKELWYAHPEPKPGEMPTLMAWKLPGHYQLEYADGTQFLIDDQGKQIWATWPADTLTLEDAATYLLGPVMGFTLLLRGFISLHACAIAVNDRSIAIMGPAGSGKSTTAAAFAERGYRILAEDVVTLRDRGTEFLVQPGYPSIRLWPSSVEALYGSGVSLPKLTPTWDKCYLDLTQDKYEFQTAPLPLAAIFLLTERTDDPAAPFVQDLSPAEKLISLIANTYAAYLMDREMRGREFRFLHRVLNAVPVKRVTSHSDSGRIGELCRTILEHV